MVDLSKLKYEINILLSAFYKFFRIFGLATTKKNPSLYSNEFVNKSCFVVSQQGYKVKHFIISKVGIYFDKNPKNKNCLHIHFILLFLVLIFETCCVYQFYYNFANSMVLHERFGVLTFDGMLYIENSFYAAFSANNSIENLLFIIVLYFSFCI